MRLEIKIALVLLIALIPYGLCSCATDEVKESLARPPLHVRMMTYNIHEGGAEMPAVDWGNGRATLSVDRRSHIVSLIRKIGADVVLLQECNGWEENDNQILNEVAGELDMHAVLAPNHGAAKVAILSRYPIAWQRWLADGNVFTHNMLIIGLALSEEQTLQVVNVHFDWTATPEWIRFDDSDDTHRDLYQQQCEILLTELQRHRYTEMIVAGDLNHHPKQNLYDFPPLYRQILDLGYVDMVEMQNPYRYDRQQTSARGEIVDYIFGASSLKGACRDSAIVKTPKAYQASDHLPLWVDLVF